MSYRGEKRQGPPPVDHLFTLKVNNLYYKTTKEMLQEAFGKFGEIGDIYIPRDMRTNESRGYNLCVFIKNK